MFRPHAVVTCIPCISAPVSWTQAPQIHPQPHIWTAVRHGRMLCRSASSKWQQAVDPASGKTYFWHVDTRETSWDPPAEDMQHEQLQQKGSSGSGTHAGSGAGDGSDISSSTDYSGMLQTLRAALEQDGSGMLFNETARSLRSDGVFSNEFFDWLAQMADSMEDADERLALSRLIARLSNPLLRQAAPFE